ncbi:hypothetical protein CASFOL_016396 [Castilleja foliolosa]|uniref:Ran-binding protein 10 n=1 Tax=Castilleja foliolosa TaxID=1961234 RepID=A0ABD3DGH8_9LAMI
MSETPSQSQPPPAKDSIGSYFIEVWRHNSKTLALNPEMELEPDFEGEEREESPTELDATSSFGAVVMVGLDKLSLSYQAASSNGIEIGMVQANRPAPMKRLLYYFEIHVKNPGTMGCMIGFTTQNPRIPLQPGSNASSDFLFYRGPFGHSGPTFTTGDTGGCGINYATKEFFVTKNGILVDALYKDFKAPVFPTLTVTSPNEEVTVNFGKDPFLFDIKSSFDATIQSLELKTTLLQQPIDIIIYSCKKNKGIPDGKAYEAEQRAKLQLKIDNMCIPQPQDARLASHRIVQSYLQHYGYGETLKLFNIAAEINVPPNHVVPESCSNEEDSMYALDHRITLRQLIKSGDIDEALSLIRQWYPQIVQDDTSTICFLIHSQKFIELVRDGKLEEAIQYGRSEFDRFKKLSLVDDLIEDCAALLAYEQPETSSVGYLLRDTQRELVADAVNAMILSTNPNVKDSSVCKHSGLERLISRSVPVTWRRGP